MSQKPWSRKPASGHWTDAYPELGRGPVSLEDCVSEEFYDKEREHVFKKTWLYMGRVERVPKSGSYFTRELRFLNTSIIIVRGKDDVIRAMHNICPHRGNKMLWEDDPFQEVQGRAPLLYCRFHGWRYKLDGSLHSATRKDLLLDFDADSCRVPAIQCEVWEGFIFVNLNPDNTESVRDYLGELAHGIEGYPFDGPHQVYRFKAELQCNWKIFLDGFAESYHGPYLHASSFGTLTAEAKEALDQPNPFTDALAYRLKRSASDVLVRRRAVAEDPVLQADRVRDGGQRGRAVEQAHRPRSDAAGAQSHPLGEVRLRLVSVLPQLHPDLRCVRLHDPHPLAHRAALAHLRNRDVLPAADDAQGTAGPGADGDVPQRHHPGRRQPVRRPAGDAEQRCAHPFHDERRGDPAAPSAQGGRRLRRGRREGGGGK